MSVLLYQGTAGGGSLPFVVRTRRHVTTMQSGMAGAEKATPQISPDGTTWVTVSIGTPPQLDTADVLRPVAAPGLYRYLVDASVGTVSIYASTEDNA